MHFKRRFFPLGVSTTCNPFKASRAETPAANYFVVLSSLNIKQIKNINYI